MYQDKNNTHTLIHVSWQKQYLHSDTCIMKNNTHTVIHVSRQKQYLNSKTCIMTGTIHTVIHLSWQKQYLHSDIYIMTETIHTQWYMYHDMSNTFIAMHVSQQHKYLYCDTCIITGTIHMLWYMYHDGVIPTIQFSYPDRSQNTYTVVLLELINKFLPVFLCVIHPVDTILVGVGNHPIWSLHRGIIKIWNGKKPYD